MKRIIAALLTIIALFSLTACDVPDSVTSPTNEETKLTFSASFYTNSGQKWLDVVGNSFEIKPNKIKEYYYDSNGSWISGYTMSSVITILIDGHEVEQTGSTVLFADTRLTQYDIDIPEEAFSSSNNEGIDIPNSISVSDYFTLRWWWKTSSLNNGTDKPRIVVIQSQDGTDICMFVGESVTWSIPEKLPKTTRIVIDGMELYIHRANFAIIDTALLD